MLERLGEKGLQQKVQPPTPPRSQLHQTTCHPVQPSHAILASPWANKDPFQASPYCDHAEQKQSVPLGCSLWSDPAFSSLQLNWFVQCSTRQSTSAFWFPCLMSMLKRAWRLRWTIPSTLSGNASAYSLWVLIWEADIHGPWPLKHTIN